MKLTTIWTLPVMSFGVRLYHTKEWIAQTIAGRLSTRIKFWAAMMVIGKAVADYTDGDLSSMSVAELLDKIEKPKGMY